MGEYEEKRETPPTSMVQQLGSSPKIIDAGAWDIRLLSYVVSSEKLPDQFKSVLYALVRADVVQNHKRFWEALTENYLVLVNAIEGRGQNNLIRAENAMKGIPVHIESPPEKPGVLDRIFDKDKVREYERWEERRELGLE